MAKKIIELVKHNDSKCLLCCDKEATMKLKINRIKHNDSIISFDVCDECLAQMQKEIEVCE